MNKQIIPNKLELAIAHAYSTGNKRLLNRLDLELIRIFEIKPSNAFRHDRKKAVGIAEVNRELLVLWHEEMLGRCVECGGTGAVEAHGKNRVHLFDCPECDGTGNDDSAEIDTCDITITDIDGNVIDADMEIEEFDIFENNCPLAAYNDEQRKLKQLSTEKVAA